MIPIDAKKLLDTLRSLEAVDWDLDRLNEEQLKILRILAYNRAELNTEVDK